MNHYQWLEKHLPQFFDNLDIDRFRYCGIISAHGDKCYGYDSKWEKANIPFPHGVAIFFLSYLRPWSEESGQTKDGWVRVDDWVIDNYEKFKPILPMEDIE